MKTKVKILDIMQMLLEKQDNSDEYYRVWYANAIKDLAILMWVDEKDYWLTH